MSQRPSTRTRRALLAVVAGTLLVGAAAACSSSEPTLPDDVSIVTLPPATDRANCTDPTGDIGSVAQTQGGNLGEPAGVDLVEARADVGENDMEVTFTVAGPVGEVDDPIFSLVHGPPGQKESFELRAQPSSGGAWSVGIITWESESGGLRETGPTDLGVPVTVEGDQVTYSIALDELPEIVSLLWQFGASGVTAVGPTTQEQRVVDDCNNMADQEAPGSTTPATTSDGSTPSTQPPSGTLGTPLASNDGITVTAFAFQKPPATTATLDPPLEPGFAPAALDAQVCATTQDVIVGPANFRVLTADNQLADSWTRTDGAAGTPAFPPTGTLPKGSCIRGWIGYELPTDADVTDVVFTPVSGGDGTGTVLWTI